MPLAGIADFKLYFKNVKDVCNLLRFYLVQKFSLIVHNTSMHTLKLIIL